MNSKALMPVNYVDKKNGIALTSYADTIVYDDNAKRKILCAIRFGGYPEQVEAMSKAIYGGGTVEVSIGGQKLLFDTLAKKYSSKINHDGVYAEATLIATDDYQPSAKAKEDNNVSSQAQKDKEVFEQTEITDLPPRSTYIYSPPGDRTALFETIDQKTAVPLIPEFADYLLQELEQRKILLPLKVCALKAQFEAWVFKCTAGDKNIISVVEDGLKNGKIVIPGAIGNKSIMPVDEVNSVTEYLTKYAPNIAERIKSLFQPLFDPEIDQISPEVLDINNNISAKAGYSLYDAQLATAEAIKRQLERRKVGLIIAECGAGKTKIGLTALAGLQANQYQRGKSKNFNIILCPSHITKKWVREIEESLPNTFAGVVRNITEFDKLYQAYSQEDRSCFAVISKETARDGYMRAPVVRWSKRHRAFICPDCGEIVMMTISDDGTSYRVKANQFFFKIENRANHKCEACGTSLWTALNPHSGRAQAWVKIGGYGFIYRPQAANHLKKTKNYAVEEKIYKIIDGTHRTVGALCKYPLSTYIKKHYKGRIDGVIVDELHQYNNDSGQGDAMGELYGVAKKVVGMTATLINGYSSGIFYLLYRLVAGLMLRDGKSYTKAADFIAEYGVVENIYMIEEGDYNSNRRTVKQKKRSRQLPGVSPLVYSRFLLEYAAFLSLADMGKELPEYEEIPIALHLPKEIFETYKKMQESLVKFMKDDKKSAKRILSAYLNLLTAYPDQPYNQPPVVHPLDGHVLVEPPDLAGFDTIFPKDQAVLDIVKRKIGAGEKVLIYTNWTRLDTQQKLLKLLTEAGYRTEILPAKIKPAQREEWVMKQLDNGVQVLITNPSLVETGLDLNAFTTLIFYDIGYKLFTLRQASRRSWRINQSAPRVEVYMLYYADTMQHKAIKLMGTKLAVAAIIEGGFSEEGLAAMSQCEDMTTLMAKELMLGIKDNVDDVSASFMRMAFVKQRSQEPVNIFADTVVAINPRQSAPMDVVEFTFAPQPTPIFGLLQSRKVQKKMGKWQPAVDENQITIFEFIA